MSRVGGNGISYQRTRYIGRRGFVLFSLCYYLALFKVRDTFQASLMLFSGLFGPGGFTDPESFRVLGVQKTFGEIGV